MIKRKKYRNTVSQNPLLRKGGVHEKTHKALRTSTKRELRAKARDSILRCHKKRRLSTPKGATGYQASSLKIQNIYFSKLNTTRRLMP